MVATVRVNAPEQTYSIYVGRMKYLKTWRRVPMKPADRAGYDKLAEDKDDPRIDPFWSNAPAAIMHCVPAYTDIDAIVGGPLLYGPHPVLVWAWSLQKRLREPITYGDSFPRLSAEESFDDCFPAMNEEAGPNVLRYLWDTDGLFYAVRDGAPLKLLNTASRPKYGVGGL
jgi:hypothetical protein